MSMVRAAIKRPALRSEEDLAQCLARIADRAPREGAHDAATIHCRDLVFGNAPPTRSGGPSLHWPTPRFPLDVIRDAITKFSWAVAFRVPEGPNQLAAHQRVFSIATSLESACFYDGYFLAMSLAAGSCKDVLCARESYCQALKKGMSCRHPLQARPSVEACQIDLRWIDKVAQWPQVSERSFLIGIVLVD